MSKISCDIIQDMLPLYYDEVCSADSRKMIEEHLQECEKCSNIFQKLKTECVVDTKENAESIQSSVMGKMAHSWKRSLLLLCFMLFKTSSMAKSVFNAH